MRITKILLSVSLMMLITLSVKAADYNFVVAQDGSGDFTTVQAAINAVPDYRKAGPTRIYIKKGIYKEKIVIAESKQNVQLIGEDGAVLTYDDYDIDHTIFYTLVCE
jgi:pectinesterase